MLHKYIVISDIHLTKEFDAAKYNCLVRIISQCETLIINGDFWKNTDTTFSEFIHSAWKKLFPLLKSKNCIYIPGNHDPLSEISLKYQDFALILTNEYEINLDGTIFSISHGHQAHPILSVLTYIHKYSIWIDRVFKSHLRMTKKQIRLTKKYKYPLMFGTLASDYLLRTSVKRKNMLKNRVIIYGHSHIPGIHSNINYVNSGFLDFNLAYYVTINTDGEYSMLSDSY